MARPMGESACISKTPGASDTDEDKIADIQKSKRNLFGKTRYCRSSYFCKE